MRKDALKINGYKEGLIYENKSVDENDQNEKRMREYDFI